MHNSLRPHPIITATLLDFLCKVNILILNFIISISLFYGFSVFIHKNVIICWFQIVPGFYPPLADKVQQGIMSSLRLILEKRVLPTLYHLFDNPKLDVELRNSLKYSFKEFCFAPTSVKGNFMSQLYGKIVTIHSENHFDVLDDMDRREDDNCAELGVHPGTNNNHHESEPAFSDDEEEVKEDEEEEEYEEERPAGTSLVQALRRLSQEDDEDDNIPLGKPTLVK